MIRFLYGDSLPRHPDLARAMFRDRAAQFSERLGWAVTVDAAGEERDAYDTLNPLYVIWQGDRGEHGGSMRFLPTTGRVMVNEHFRHLSGGGTIASPLIWECTRFCLAPGAGDAFRRSAGLMAAGAFLGRRMGLAHAVGVFEAPMLRLYRALGWPPDIPSKAPGDISVGFWDFTAAPLARLCRRAGITEAQLAEWFASDLAPQSQAAQ